MALVTDTRRPYPFVVQVNIREMALAAIAKELRISLLSSKGAQVDAVWSWLTGGGKAKTKDRKRVVPSEALPNSENIH